MRMKSKLAFEVSLVQVFRGISKSMRRFPRESFSQVTTVMVLLVFGLGLITAPAAHAKNYAATVLHSFQGSPSDGTNPSGGSLILDSNGNLYGTTAGGGASGNGTVFELVNSGGSYTEKVLYSFTGGADGASPSGGLLIDAAGNLYGTTQRGGTSGLGTVFELVNSGGSYTEVVLHSFTGPDGQIPNGGLTRDSAGNLYGAAYNNSFRGGDNGVVFELVNSAGTYTEKVLFAFPGGAGGSGPMGPLAIDASGNLYGNAVSTQFQGDPGLVFKLVNSSGTYTETVLHQFTSGTSDGSGPTAGLLLDAGGNLYGTTTGGGVSGSGTVFELVNSSGTYGEVILHSFTGGNPDGGGPNGGLIKDAAGNLYGTTTGSGTSGSGAVFELVKSSGAFTFKVLHTFLANYCSTDGALPQAGLVMDASGNLYGTTEAGGNNISNLQGTVFELVAYTGQPATTTTTLVSSLNPANAGDPLTLTATVTPNSNLNFVLSGTLTISNGSLVLASAPLGCGATAQLSVEDANDLGIGLNTITAKYTPDTAAFASSKGTLDQVVNEPGAVLTRGNNTLNGNQTVNGTVNATSLIGGSLAVGGGTPIAEYTSTTRAITLPALNPFSCTQFTTPALTGFAPGVSDTIALGIPSSLQTGLGDGVFLIYQAWETNANASPTITIRVCNPSLSFYSGGASGTVRVSIFKH